nr:histidine kinase dimerization/phosphoacceptor domain -containing protein [uncultured Methanobacterium sp.]
MNFISDSGELPFISGGLWESIFNSIEVPIMILDKEHKIVRINESMIDTAAIKGNVIGKKCYNIIHGTSTPPEFCPHSKTIQNNEEYTEEVEFPDFWLLVSTSPIYDFDGNLIGSGHIAQDITKQKEAEKKIQDLLEIKELLMKETHHRVKNNLVTISSLLFLQAMNIKDKDAKEALLDSQNRARSMAIIHQKLYSYADFEKVDLNLYFRQLIDEVIKSYSASEIRYFLDVDNISFNVDTALILGLIVNELVSNSLKYAFPEDKKGIIRVNLHKINDEYVLNVSDNGKSNLENINLENPDSFGLTIVNLLVTQLNGQFSVKRDEGTIFTINFE